VRSIIFFIIYNFQQFFKEIKKILIERETNLINYSSHFVSKNYIFIGVDFSYMLGLVLLLLLILIITLKN